MPKKKGLTKAERKQNKYESARRYYLQNKEKVTEKARLHMQKYRFRNKVRAVGDRQKEEQEKVRLAERRLAAMQGSRKLAQWPRPGDSYSDARDECSSDDASAFGDSGTEESMDPSENSADQSHDESSSKPERQLPRPREYFLEGRWYILDEEGSLEEEEHQENEQENGHYEPERNHTEEEEIREEEMRLGKQPSESDSQSRSPEEQPDGPSVSSVISASTSLVCNARSYAKPAFTPILQPHGSTRDVKIIPGLADESDSDRELPEAPCPGDPEYDECMRDYERRRLLQKYSFMKY